MEKKETTKFIEKGLQHFGINLPLKTAKRILKNQQQKSDCKNNKQFWLDFFESCRKAENRKHQKSDKIRLQIPNAFPVLQCLNFNIKKHEIPEFALTDTEFDYVIKNETDELYLQHENGDVKFTGFSFADLILISAFYTIIRNDEKRGETDKFYSNEKVYKIGLENVFSLLYPGKRWDKTSIAVKNALNRKIIAMNDKVKKANGKYFRFGKKQTQDYRGFLFLRIANVEYKNNSAEYTVKISENSLLLVSEQQKRIVSIAPEYLQFPYYNEGNNYLALWYLAYRINVSRNDKNRMKPAISIETLDFVCGKVSRPLLKRYFNYLQENGIIADFSVSRLHITYSFPEAVIVIRNAEKKEIKKAMPKDVLAVQNALIKYNVFAGKQDVRCNGEKVNGALHAVYSNSDWKQGGRLYSKVQELTSDDRQEITINGENTIELDFASLHPNMLFASQGIQLKDDPYLFTENRKLAKKALNIMLNSSNENEAIGAIKKYMQEKEIENITAKNVIENCIKKHSAISKFFFSGIGLKLQNRDAKIALKIITEFQRENIVCLPVHDSFIVPAKYENKLREMMKKTYAELNNGFSIEIKPNKGDLIVNQAVKGLSNEIDIFAC